MIYSLDARRESREARKSFQYLYLVRKGTLEPRQFIKKWGINQIRLAELLGVSLSLVRGWMQKRNPRIPEQRHLDRLTEIDWILEHGRTLSTTSTAIASLIAYPQERFSAIQVNLNLL